MASFHPTLKHFILRQEVIHLYRRAIRSSKDIQDPMTRKETLAWIRNEFERNKHITDVALIEDKIRAGRRELRQLFPSNGEFTSSTPASLKAYGSQLP